MPPIQGQYGSDADFTEMMDPTFREEEAWLIAEEEKQREEGQYRWLIENIIWIPDGTSIVLYNICRCCCSR